MSEIICPECQGTHIYVHKKGFNLGYAVVGAIVVNSIVGYIVKTTSSDHPEYLPFAVLAIIATGGGLLAGCYESNDIMVTCLDCGHSYKAAPKPAVAKETEEEPAAEK